MNVQGVFLLTIKRDPGVGPGTRNAVVIEDNETAAKHRAHAASWDAAWLDADFRIVATTNQAIPPQVLAMDEP